MILKLTDLVIAHIIKNLLQKDLESLRKTGNLKVIGFLNSRWTLPGPHKSLNLIQSHISVEVDFILDKERDYLILLWKLFSKRKNDTSFQSEKILKINLSFKLLKIHYQT